MFIALLVMKCYNTCFYFTFFFSLLFYFCSIMSPVGVNEHYALRKICRKMSDFEVCRSYEERHIVVNASEWMWCYQSEWYLIFSSVFISVNVVSFVHSKEASVKYVRVLALKNCYYWFMRFYLKWKKEKFTFLFVCLKLSRKIHFSTFSMIMCAENPLNLLGICFTKMLLKIISVSAKSVCMRKSI